MESPDAKDGTVVFEIDGMSVGFVHDPTEDVVMVVAEIGEQNPDADEACSSALLKANYLFAGTGGATLCRNPETGAFAIMRSWPLASLDGKTATVTVSIDKDISTMGTKYNEYKIGTAKFSQKTKIDLTKPMPEVVDVTFSQTYSPDKIRHNPNIAPILQ
jgi:hypothetical protein